LIEAYFTMLLYSIFDLKNHCMQDNKGTSIVNVYSFQCT